MERAEEQRQPTPRTIGAVYLLYFLTAFSAAFLTRGLVVPGDPAATAHNLLAHESLYRAGFAVDILSNVLYLAVTAFFYRLFGPVNWSLSALAAFLSIAGCAVQLCGGLLRLAPLLLLAENPLLHVARLDQLQAAALLSLTLHSQTGSIALILFGFYDLLLGYLIYQSGFLPRSLGVFLLYAGVGWLTFLWPPLASVLSSYVLPLGALAEIALMLWLLVRGVNVSAFPASFARPQKEREVQ